MIRTEVDLREKGIVLYVVVVVITVATGSPMLEAVLSALATSKHQRKRYLNPVSLVFGAALQQAWMLV
jgi:hypothetical protein